MNNEIKTCNICWKNEATTTIKDCMGNEFPACGECLDEHE